MDKKLEALVRSRRFWTSVAGVVFVVTDGLGLGFDPETVTRIVLLAGAWIVGDSLRKTE